MAAFEWDCDCGWSEWDLDSTEWTAASSSPASSSSKRHAPPPPPPPFFDLPPPPLPPSLQPPPELCSSAADHPLGLETCQAFLVSDAERQIPVDSSASTATIVVPAVVVLCIAFVIIGFIAWRFRKQKMNQKALLRCQQKTINGAGGVGVGGGMMDGMMVPALLQGLNGRQVATGITGGVNDDEDGVFYDELSYPPQFRAPNHPPAYEMKDVLLESTSPCHCTAHPLLGNGRNVRNGGCNAVGPLSGVGGVGLMHCQQQQQQPHYVTSPYRCGSHSPPSSTTPTIDDQHDCSWITEPVYEELPSGPEEDGRFSRDQRSRHRNDSVGINDSLRSQRGGSAYQRPSNYWSGAEEPGETDFFLPPSTWYHQQQTQHSTPILKGHMTTHGQVRKGRGGIQAAWREMESSPQLQPQQQQRTRGTSSSAGQPNSGRRKRKVKSMKNPPAGSGGGVGAGLEILDHQNLHYHCTGLYRGLCPPEEPPFIAGENDPPVASLLDQDSPVPSEQLSTPTKTQPRYYYYSESDDYGVMNPPSRTLSNSRRGVQQQRHLSRVNRTVQPRSPTSVSSDNNKNVDLN